MGSMPKCPGAFSRKLDSTIVPCPSCGRKVEIFSDEARYRCRCGRLVFHESIPSCAEWCKAAEQCLGEAFDPEQLERRLAEAEDDPRAKECLEAIRQRLEARKS